MLYARRSETAAPGGSHKRSDLSLSGWSAGPEGSGFNDSHAQYTANNAQANAAIPSPRLSSLTGQGMAQGAFGVVSQSSGSSPRRQPPSGSALGPGLPQGRMLSTEEYRGLGGGDFQGGGYPSGPSFSQGMSHGDLYASPLRMTSPARANLTTGPSVGYNINTDEEIPVPPPEALGPRRSYPVNFYPRYSSLSIPSLPQRRGSLDPMPRRGSLPPLEELLHTRSREGSLSPQAQVALQRLNEQQPGTIVYTEEQYAPGSMSKTRYESSTFTYSVPLQPSSPPRLPSASSQISHLRPRLFPESYIQPEEGPTTPAISPAVEVIEQSPRPSSSDQMISTASSPSAQSTAVSRRGSMSRRFSVVPHPEGLGVGSGVYTDPNYVPGQCTLEKYGVGGSGVISVSFSGDGNRVETGTDGQMGFETNAHGAASSPVARSNKFLHAVPKRLEIPSIDDRASEGQATPMTPSSPISSMDAQPFSWVPSQRNMGSVAEDMAQAMVRDMAQDIARTSPTPRAAFTDRDGWQEGPALSSTGHQDQGERHSSPRTQQSRRPVHVYTGSPRARSISSPTRFPSSPTRRASNPTRPTISPTRRTSNPTRPASIPARPTSSPARPTSSPTKVSDSLNFNSRQVATPSPGVSPIFPQGSPIRPAQLQSEGSQQTSSGERRRSLQDEGFNRRRSASSPVAFSSSVSEMTYESSPRYNPGAPQQSLRGDTGVSMTDDSLAGRVPFRQQVSDTITVEWEPWDFADLPPVKLPSPLATPRLPQNTVPEPRPVQLSYSPPAKAMGWWPSSTMSSDQMLADSIGLDPKTRYAPGNAGRLATSPTSYNQPHGPDDGPKPLRPAGGPDIRNYFSTSSLMPGPLMMPNDAVPSGLSDPSSYNTTSERTTQPPQSSIKRLPAPDQLFRDSMLPGATASLAHNHAGNSPPPQTSAQGPGLHDTAGGSFASRPPLSSLSAHTRVPEALSGFRGRQHSDNLSAFHKLPLSAGDILRAVQDTSVDGPMPQTHFDPLRGRSFSSGTWTSSLDNGRKRSASQPATGHGSTNFGSLAMDYSKGATVGMPISTQAWRQAPPPTPKSTAAEDQAMPRFPIPSQPSPRSTPLPGASPLWSLEGSQRGSVGGGVDLGMRHLPRSASSTQTKMPQVPHGGSLSPRSSTFQFSNGASELAGPGSHAATVVPKPNSESSSWQIKPLRRIPFPTLQSELNVDSYASQFSELGPQSPPVTKSPTAHLTPPLPIQISFSSPKQKNSIIGARKADLSRQQAVAKSRSPAPSSAPSPVFEAGLSTNLESGTTPSVPQPLLYSRGRSHSVSNGYELRHCSRTVEMFSMPPGLTDRRRCSSAPASDRSAFSGGTSGDQSPKRTPSPSVSRQGSFCRNMLYLAPGSHTITIQRKAFAHLAPAVSCYPVPVTY